MLDPGTALAVASMAMGVAKELWTFFNAWKSCPEDVLALRAALLWFRQTFQLVKTTLRNHKTLRMGAEATYDTVIINVEDCKSKVETLKTELDKVQIERRKETWEKIKNELKRFRYYFSKETIANMLMTIRQCEGNLQVTIHLLNLGTIANVLDEVRSLSATVGDVAQVRDDNLKAEFKNLRDLVAEQADQSDVRRQLNLLLKDNDHKQALVWLVPQERQRTISRFQTTLYRSREFGTGSWFINSSVFQRWQEEPNTCLWLQGSVGSGKSVLVSTVIHDLQQRCYIRADDDHGDVLIYHYFSHTEEFLQLPEPMLRSCIAQAGFRGSVKSLLVDYCARYNSTFMPEDPSLNEMTAFLATLLKTLFGSEPLRVGHGSNVSQGQIFLILDALDEIPFGNQRDEVLRFVQFIKGLQQPNLHLLLTSRAGTAEKDIADILDQDSTEPQMDQANSYDYGVNESVQPSGAAPIQMKVMKYVMTADDVKTDIELVVQKELRTHRRLKTLQREAKELILENLVRLGQPNFREIALQITKLTSAELSKDTTPETILKILGHQSNELARSSISIEAVPYRLDDLYQQLLDAIPPTLLSMVSNALQWLLHSKRSLSLDEFIDICAFQKDSTGTLIFSETRRRLPHELLAMFAGLVVARSISLPSQSDKVSESRISLAHISVKEFLTRAGGSAKLGALYDPLAAHQLIADCCIRYLMHSNFIHKRSEQYALRNYAWNYWSWHCVRTRPQDDTTSIIERKLKNRANRIDNVLGSEIEVYLAGMLWALIGIQLLGNSKEVSIRLAFPYFYQELPTDTEPDNDVWDDKRISYYQDILEAPADQVRLVELLDTDDELSELRARVEIANSIHERSYEVVTYLSDTTKQSSMLRVNGMPYVIPEGLEHVLQRLRRSGTASARTLWIDAISIDQSGTEDRSIMTSRLPEVFRHASSHAIFAEASAKQSDAEAIKLIKDIDRAYASRSESEVAVRLSLYDLINKYPIESLLKPLFNRRIWTRIWPIQEMVLSQNATIFYGENQISTDVLERVLLQHKILESYFLSGQQTTANHFVSDRTWRSAVEMTRTRAENREGQGVRPLRALYASRYLQCHDPRDRVFAILCLLPRVSMSHLRVDYGHPPLLVFVNLSLALLATYRNLDMFSLNSHESGFDIPLPELPSWVSTFTIDKRETWPLVTSCFTYPVVDDVYKACGQFDHVGTSHNVKGYVTELVLDGCVVDHVQSIYLQLDDPTIATVAAQRRSIFSDPTVGAESMKLLGPGETLISAYWRTTCANQASIGELIPPGGELSKGRSIPTGEAQELLWTSEEHQPIALSFSENRRFFISAAGRLGLAPAMVAEGDCVTICAGGKVPYILRPTGDGKYTLMGESYVHGIMHGEAIIGYDSNKFQPLTII